MKLAGLAALSVIFTGFLCGCRSADGGNGDTTSTASALTAAQCDYFQVGGKTRICHATGSARNPYVLLSVSEEACINAHSVHARDYVSVNDPTCNGQGCLPSGAPCDASLPCCSGLACRNGTCAPVDLCQNVTCVASDQCHVSSCDPVTGRCLNEPKVDRFPCDDANACTSSDACLAGACTGGNPVICTAKDQCHAIGLCDTATGTCSNPTKADDTTCDDGDACTEADTCQAGICTSGGLVCIATCVSPPPNIAGWWSGNGTAQDELRRSNGNLVGGTYSAGESGQAFDLNGGSYVDIPSTSSLAITGDITVETWIYPRSGSGGIATKLDNGIPTDGVWGFEFFNNPSLGLIDRSVGFTISTLASYYRLFTPQGSVPTNAWTHVAATASGGTVTLYVNGQAVPPSVLTGYDPPAPPGAAPSVKPNSFNLLLGAYQRNGIKEQFFDGLIDETSVYSRALSAAEVREVYQAGSAGKCSSPDGGQWTTTGSMSLARYDFTATPLADGRILVAGGQADSNHALASNVLASAEIYDPSSGTFGTTGAMHQARTYQAAERLSDGRVLIVGGFWGVAFNSTELFDPQIGTFSDGGPMLWRRSFPTATRMNDGRVLVAGGFNGAEGALRSAEVYDPATNSFSAVGTMATARQNHAAVLLGNGHVLVVGGSDGMQELNVAEEFDPATSSFTTIGTLRHPKSHPTVTLLGDGRVLIAGGENQANGTLADADLYDSVTGVISACGDMGVGRSRHTAVRLPSGKVIVAGGFTQGAFGAGTTSSEIFDPGLAIFRPLADMNFARGEHTMVPLSGGRVLVAGGFANGAISSAEFLTLEP